VFNVRTLGLAIAGALMAITAAHADQAQDMAAFQSFRLDDAFMAKYQAAEADAAKDPCHLAPLGLLHGDSNKSLDQVAADYDKQPGVHAMLARHGLTAREDILGAMTLMVAGMETLQKQHPGMVQMSGTMPPIPPANLAYFQAHQADLQQHAMAIGKAQMAANHGKLPACLAH
jgi:hypothetical protein